MPVTKDFLEYVLDQLRDVPFVTTKRMFGGAGLWSDGVFFAILFNNKLYLKANKPHIADFKKRGAENRRV